MTLYLKFIHATSPNLVITLHDKSLPQNQAFYGSDSKEVNNLKMKAPKRICCLEAISWTQ